MVVPLSEPYEVHLTVELNGRDSGILAAFAEAKGFRFLHIRLDQGVYASQPMLSWRQAEGVDEALERSAMVAKEVEHVGMRLVRTKVEADVSCDSSVPPAYFEAHFKVELSVSRTRELEKVAGDLGVHLSRNARSQRLGKEERYLTARHSVEGAARELFDRVEGALKRGGWCVVGVRREAVLYDSNLNLDDGWA